MDWRDRDGPGYRRGMGPPPHRADYGGPPTITGRLGMPPHGAPFYGAGGGPPGRDRDRDLHAAGRGGMGPLAGPGPGVPASAGAASAAAPPQPEIDREKTCPLLMRVFPKRGGHHRLEEFTGKALPEEMQFYTWMDATLRELTDLVKSAHPAARGRTARLSFAFIYPDRRGHNVMRQVGGVQSTRPGDDDEKTLRQLNFQTGDYLDVAIYS